MSYPSLMVFVPDLAIFSSKHLTFTPERQRMVTKITFQSCLRRYQVRFFKADFTERQNCQEEMPRVSPML